MKRMIVGVVLLTMVLIPTIAVEAYEPVDDTTDEDDGDSLTEHPNRPPRQQRTIIPPVRPDNGSLTLNTMLLENQVL